MLKNSEISVMPTCPAGKGATDYNFVRNRGTSAWPVVLPPQLRHNPTVGMVETEPEGRGPVVTIVAVIVLIVAIAVLFYGLAGLHWFGFDAPPDVGATPSVTPTPAASPSASGTASASASP